MGNSLGIELEGKMVVLKAKYLRFSMTEVQRVFLVEHGFGAAPYAIGNALFGEFVYDGERTRMEGYMVERLANEQEVVEAKALRAAADREKNRATVLFQLTVGDVEDTIGGEVSPEHFDDWRKTLENGLDWAQVIDYGVPPDDPIPA